MLGISAAPHNHQELMGFLNASPTLKVIQPYDSIVFGATWCTLGAPLANQDNHFDVFSFPRLQEGRGRGYAQPQNISKHKDLHSFRGGGSRCTPPRESFVGGRGGCVARIP